MQYDKDAWSSSSEEAKEKDVMGDELAVTHLHAVADQDWAEFIEESEGMKLGGHGSEDIDLEPVFQLQGNPASPVRPQKKRGRKNKILEELMEQFPMPEVPINIVGGGGEGQVSQGSIPQEHVGVKKVVPPEVLGVPMVPAGELLPISSNGFATSHPLHVSLQAATGAALSSSSHHLWMLWFESWLRSIWIQISTSHLVLFWNKKLGLISNH